MPLSRTGAKATLLAVAACAVALVAVSEAAPAVVGSFEDLIGKVQRPWAVSPGAFPRNAERVPCFLSESDELPALMEPLEPLGDDLPSLDAAEVEAALTPISPRADTSVPVYRGSSVGSKAWYRGVAARDEDADDNPTRMSMSLFLKEKEPVQFPILGVGEVFAKDGIKVVSFREYSDIPANDVTEDPVEDPVEDDTEDLPKANEFPVEETTENLDKESSGVFRNLPDNNSPWRVPAGHHLFSRNGYSEDFAQGVAEDLDEDAAKDLVPENVI